MILSLETDTEAIVKRILSNFHLRGNKVFFFFLREFSLKIHPSPSRVASTCTSISNSVVSRKRCIILVMSCGSKGKIDKWVKLINKGSERDNKMCQIHDWWTIVCSIFCHIKTTWKFSNVIDSACKVSTHNKLLERSLSQFNTPTWSETSHQFIARSLDQNSKRLCGFSSRHELRLFERLDMIRVSTTDQQ